MEIYLDNAATTQPLTQNAIQRHLQQAWYNPSAAYKQAESVFKEIKTYPAEPDRSCPIAGDMYFHIRRYRSQQSYTYISMQARCALCLKRD